MATYREIHGKAIKTVDANPTDDAATGQIWFNSTDDTFKSIVTLTSATSQPGVTRSAPTAVQMASASGGSSDANWVAGGNTYVNSTEEWNGTGWSDGGNLNVSGLNRSGFGTLTAGVCVGGMIPPPPTASNATEEYNGSAWSAVNAMPEALRGLCGGGPETAGIMYSGHGNPPLYSVASDKTKYYDGTNWSVPPATMNSARSNMSGCGTQSAALGVSGESGPLGPPAGSMVEEYNGSAWTAAPTLNTARGNQGPATCQGSTTNATILGGNPPSGNAIENYDGTSWTTNSTTLAGNNSQSAGFGASGDSIGIFGGGYNISEVYSVSTNAITAGAWSSGGNLPQDSRGGGSAGTQTAAWYVGGLQYPSDTKNRTDTYNGTSWTNVNNLPDNFFAGNSCGTDTAGLIFGSNQGYGVEEQTYEWDGTNWTAGGSLPDIGPAYGNAGGGGTQTAAVACGGYGDPPPGVSQVMEYNGSSWSANPNSLPTGNYNQAGDGTSTALWLAGGYLQSSTTLNFDGTSFSAQGNLNSPRQYACGAGYGTQTSAIVAGGDPGTDTQGEQYNGTSWVSAPSLSQGRKYGLGASRSAGSQTGFIAGGATPPNPNTNKTEEFNPETTALNVKTLTQS
jgi:hypothetical protein